MLPANLKTLVHFNGADAATTFPDFTGRHTWSANGNAQLDTAQKKYGASALLLDGTGDFISSPDSPDWKICAATNETWTISLQIKFNVATGLQYLASQFVNATNYWDILHYDGNGLRFICVAGGSNVIVMSYAGEINDTNWHEIMIHKKAGAPNAMWGMYKDGQQILNVSSAGIANFTAPLHIGTENAGGYVNGWVDELMICQSNPFNADPQADNSDTVTPTSKEWGVEALNRVMAVQ